MQADAKAKRSGIAPAQIVGETEQAWSCGHDESAYCCIETDEEAAICDGARQLHEGVQNNITTYFKTGGGDYAAAAQQSDQVLRFTIVRNPYTRLVSA